MLNFDLSYFMENQLAFIDEFGNNGLEFDKAGTSEYFIVSAIIVDKENQYDLEAKLDDIRKRHFQTGEIKSSNVGVNDKRRIEILSKLSALDYHVFSIVVDKRQLYGEGFKFKKSFFKFLHSLVDRELFRVFPSLLIVADEHGSKEFMDGFIEYVKRRHIPDLFNQSDFKFSNHWRPVNNVFRIKKATC